MLFENREKAGCLLANHLVAYTGRRNTLVLGIPRGGISVAYEIARKLRLPFEAFVVCKLGVPDNPELAMGALTSGGVCVINQHIADRAHVTEEQMAQVIKTVSLEVIRRERLYRAGRPAPGAKGQTIILVDDGLATGLTMRAALKALRTDHPWRCIVAVPVASAATIRELRAYADDVVCLSTPYPFIAVGNSYVDFSPVSDDAVCKLLTQMRYKLPMLTSAK